MSGIGLHTGQDTSVTFFPAEDNSGIVFSLNGKKTRALAENVTDTKRGVSLGGIILVEHVLAAAAGAGLDNLMIELKSNESPAMDGSALPYYEAFLSAGIAEQRSDKKILEVKEPVEISEKEAKLIALPYSGFKVDFMLDFPIIGLQEVRYDGDFTQVAGARTFGLAEELDSLVKSGLARGASLDNALGIDAKGYMNRPRFPDEPVRHKVLDLIGDLKLTGGEVRGHFKAIRTGHRHNVALALKLRDKGG